MTTATITWHATAAQMPDDDEMVLITWPDGEVHMGWHDGDDGWRTVDATPCEPPTWWATLPEAPK